MTLKSPARDSHTHTHGKVRNTTEQRERPHNHTSESLFWTHPAETSRTLNIKDQAIHNRRGYYSMYILAVLRVTAGVKCH